MKKLKWDRRFFRLSHIFLYIIKNLDRNENAYSLDEWE